VNAHRTNALETDRASDMSRPEAAVGSHALRDAWSCKDFGVTAYVKAAVVCLTASR
jgi:hypothetical protein